MLDTITIELKVTAVQGESDIWMQGDLEITINGENHTAIATLLILILCWKA